MTNEPLIYTTQGNVLISLLTYEHQWEDGSDAVRFTERYRDSAGEIVKESVHVYLKQPLETTSKQGIF